MSFVIRNTKEDKPRFLRCGVYGETSVGKTWFAASFPRPFFFSVGAESGISSLSQLPYAVDYALIESTADMRQAVSLFRDKYKEKDWRTAVIDTASVYGRFISMEQSHYGDYAMDQQKWGKVLGHLLNIRDVVHNCECHVVWVFHPDDEKSGDIIIKRRPRLVGQARQEIIQTLGLLCYMDRYEKPAEVDEKGNVTKDGETVRRLFVKCPNNMNPQFEVKNWYEGALKSTCYKPFFNVLAKELAPQHITSLLDPEPAVVESK